MPSSKSSTKGKHQLADLSTNSTNRSPEIGLLNAVMNAHKMAHPTTARIGYSKTVKAIMISAMPMYGIKATAWLSENP